jgi:hypothetical protein
VFLILFSGADVSDQVNKTFSAIQSHTEVLYRILTSEIIHMCTVVGLDVSRGG